MIVPPIMREQFVHRGPIPLATSPARAGLDNAVSRHVSISNLDRTSPSQSPCPCPVSRYHHARGAKHLLGERPRNLWESRQGRGTACGALWRAPR
eukprot:4876057-Pyramimonas_sp.AAC.1